MIPKPVLETRVWTIRASAPDHCPVHNVWNPTVPPAGPLTEDNFAVGERTRGYIPNGCSTLPWLTKGVRQRRPWVRSMRQRKCLGRRTEI